MVRLFAFAKLTFVCLGIEKQITLLTNLPKNFSLGMNAKQALLINVKY